MRILCLLLGVAAMSALPAAEPQILVPRGADWKYLDDGSDQGTVWKEADFDDGAWTSGMAKLGYGDKDVATKVSPGPDKEHKFVTTYFRHDFSVEDPAKTAQLVFRILRDDGVVVYLNGTEVLRDNMPAGEVDFQTPAAKTVRHEDEKEYFEFTVPPEALKAGQNVLAVELHQCKGESTDIGFDLELAAAAP